MKKLLLLLTLFFSTSILLAQNFNQPTQFNNVCDDNNDGIASFWLGEISFEILGNLNSQDYGVTHHETQADATIGANAMPSPYMNINPFTQTIFVRIVTVATSEVTILTYNLNVNSGPPAPTVTVTNCASVITSFPCWDLTSVEGQIVQGQVSVFVTYYQTLADAQTGSNSIQNPSCYISPIMAPIQPPIYYRAGFAGNGCFSIGMIELVTITCEPQPGQPINLVVCGDNTNGCFNLTANDSYIIGNLNTSEYTITYHLSQANADNDVLAITNPTNFCAQHGLIIYARLENNTTTTYQTFTFALMVDTFTNNVITLNDMSQCDNDTDSIVIFNLTLIQSQINTGNALEYYPSLSNAQNQVVPFSNPSTVNIGVQNTTTNVFVREIVPNGCDNIYNFQLYAFANCNVSYTCAQANSLCNSLGNPFSNTIGGFINQNPISCLGSTPNPTWFYLPISSGGTVNLQISQVSNSGGQIDVDYIVHGPFTDPISPCTDQTQLLNNVVSCSYSAAATEYPIIPNAQPGQFYLIMVTNFSGQAGLITISELPSSTATIDCSGFRLNAFLDSNNNGTQDSGEQNFPLGQFTYEINNNGNVHNIVSSTGVYNIYDIVASNSYDLSYAINPNYIASYSLSTASYSNVHVVVGAGVTTYNFPVTITQVYNDLAVNIIPLNAPRPGFVYMNKIVYTNNGNQTVTSGTVTFNHDSLVSITANTQAGTTPITNGFTHNFTNLLPFESRETVVTMQVPPIPTVTIGGLLTNTASIVPLTGDVVPENNSATNTQIIIGAYDPNDKMEAHGERILHSTFTPNDFLTYTIRFENTGTADAINVRVNDVLNSQLDMNSVRMISASHSYIMDRMGNNINWYFDDIMLPPSVADTNIGKGYITFMVKPMPGYAVGDIIPNTASIYFDFNPAIVTNTFNTQFVAQLGVDEFENADFVFYPNPVSDIVTITVKNNGSIANIAVYDVLGKMIIAQKPANALSTQTLDLSSVSKGMYLLEVTTDANLKVVKKLIVD